MSRSLTDFKKRQIGKGLVAPMQRIGGKDFYAAQGTALIRACIMQILMTRSKELPWKPEFPGFDFERIRHKNQSDRLLHQLQADVERAILTWEPRVSLVKVDATADTVTHKITVRVDWGVRMTNHPESPMLIGPVTTIIEQ